MKIHFIGAAQTVTVLIVGYSAENTLGRKLAEKFSIVKIFGEEHALNAEVIVFNSFSAHADANELIDYVSKFDRNKLRKIFLVHGDKDQQDKYKIRLNAVGFDDVVIPQKKDVFEL